MSARIPTTAELFPAETTAALENLKNAAGEGIAEKPSDALTKRRPDRRTAPRPPTRPAARGPRGAHRLEEPRVSADETPQP